MSSSESGARRRRDAGFTLPELLVSIIVLGSIVAVLASTIIVTFQQRDNTEGRLNVTRAEQNVDMWIPADLASTGSVPSTDPSMSPCSPNPPGVNGDTSSCPSNVELTGSNALFLSWVDTESVIGVGLVTVTTNVSYHFTPRADGTFDLMRIACVSRDSGPSTPSGPWTCEVFSVLTKLPGPSDGAFDPGVTVPLWVLQVSVPLPPDMIEPGDTSVTYVNNKNANRVVVTINGGGDAVGLGGGINQVSITAGGTTRNTLPRDSLAGAPTFTQTQSRCGGPLTLIVDDSGSIGSAMDTVKAGVIDFVESLAGTPVQIQIVRFDNTASVLGTTEWSKYFDMTVATDVTALAGVNGVGGAINTLAASGGTNWEDAWFRTFYAEDGTPAAITPRTVVFFTDGIPTRDRIDVNYRGGSVDFFDPLKPPAAGPGWYASDGINFSQVGFDRTDYYAAGRRAADDTRLIGVGVGPGIGELPPAPIAPPPAPSTQSEWMENARIAYRNSWEERTTFNWQQSAFTYWQFFNLWEQSTFTYQEAGTWDEQVANAWQRRLRSGPGPWISATPTDYSGNVNSGTYEYRINPGAWTWSSSTRAPYDVGNTDPGDTDGWRRINPSGSVLTGRTLAQYLANNTTNDNSDNVARVSTGSGWSTITQAVYDANNTTTNSSDGFRTSSGWNSITAAAYDTGNTTNDDTDGFRRTSTGNGWFSISKATYDANNTTSAETDGFRRISPSGAWVEITQAEYTARNTTSNESDGVRLGPDVDDPSGTFFRPAVTVTTRNAAILAKLISGNFNGEPWSGTLNTNERVANLFIESNWADVPLALKAVALGECGGTLTLQTKVGSAYATDAFEYQNTALTDSSGNPLQSNENTVITNISTKAATFDFNISDGTFRTVEIELVPDGGQIAAGYTGGTWSCKSGVDDETIETYSIPDTPWSGFRVQVGANEAVSCVHSVTGG